jgi:hypothetical protein
MYWTASAYSGPPLILVDWSRAPFTPTLWREIDDRLVELTIERRARIGSVGAFVEGIYLAKLGEMSGCAVAPIPEHLMAAKEWPAMCQAAALHVGGDRVTIARAAYERIESSDNPAPFRSAMNASFGPRDEEDPTVPAFVLGIVLGLDETLARPAVRKPAKTNANRART